MREAVPANFGDDAPQIGVDPTQLEQGGDRIQVTCGANVLYFPNLIGQTIKDVKKSLKEILNIPNNAKVLIHGQEVEHDYVLKQGDWLEFLKEAGIKG